MNRADMSATARAEAARRTTKDAITRELLLVAVLSRCPGFHGYVARPARPNDEYQWLVILETPAGPLAWRLTALDVPLFEHLGEPQDRVSAVQATDKTAVLMWLAMEGLEAK